MFDSIRKHQRILQFVLVLLIFPAFAFFGISGYDRFFSDSGAVATVDGTPIPIAAYDAARRDQIEQLRRIAGGTVDPALLNTPAMRARVLDQLIAQELLRGEAIHRRVTVGDEQLRDVIRGFPQLHKEDGSFDIERYRGQLAALGKSEAAFEFELRGDLIRRAIPEALQSTALVPDEAARFLFAASEERRLVAEKRFRPEAFVGKVKPSEEEVAAYYKANPKRFELAESVKAEYLVFSAATLAEGIIPPDSEVQAYYEQNKSRFGSAEERRASHILVAVAADAPADARRRAKEKAEAILARLRAGEDFASIAAKESDDTPTRSSGGDLDFFTRDTMVKPFADAAFALHKGETSGIVETEFGYHVIKLTDVRPAKLKPLSAVREEIVGELRGAMARQRFAEQADAFTNTVYEQPDGLGPAAEKFKLHVVVADKVLRSGEAGKPDSPLNNRRVLAALFSDDAVKGRRNTEAIEIGDNALLAARVVEHHPARVPPIEDIRAQVESMLRAEQAAKLAREEGANELAALRKGGPATGFGSAQELARAGGANLPAAAVEAVFRINGESAPAFAGVDLGALGYAIYRLDKVIRPDDEQLAKGITAFRAQLAGAYGGETAEAWLNALRARAKIQTYPDRIPAAPADN